MSRTVLALEWSSTRLSVGWSVDGVCEERVLELRRFQAELALPFLEEIIQEIPLPSEVRLGRGPGNYSGIRQSLAWAFGFAAPGEIRLRSCASGVAQAFRLQQELQEPFAVLGDARRGVWWGAVFPDDEVCWRLQSPEEWTKEVAEIPVFSQEATRLKPAPFAVQEDYPRALDLLALPEELTGKELLPLYLHPAV